MGKDRATTDNMSMTGNRRRVGCQRWVRDHAGAVVFLVIVLTIVILVSAAQENLLDVLDSIGIERRNGLHIILYIYVVSFPWFLAHCLPILIWAVPSGYFFGELAIPLVLVVLTYMSMLQFFLGRKVTRRWLEVREEYPCLECLPTFGAAPERPLGAFSPTSAYGSTTSGSDMQDANNDTAAASTAAEEEPTEGVCSDFALYMSGLQRAFYENPRKMSFILMWCPFIPSSTMFTLAGHYTDVSATDFLIATVPANALIYAPPIFIAAQVSKLDEAFDSSRSDNFALFVTSIVVVVVLLIVTSYLTRRELAKISNTAAAARSAPDSPPDRPDAVAL